MGKAYLFLSGKGGTGKTTVAASIGLKLARDGRRTVLVDADVGLRCADILLNMENDIVYDASDVLEDRSVVEEALTACPAENNLYLLSAPQMMNPSDVDKKAMNGVIRDLKTRFDYVLIDCPAGIGRGLRNVWSEADEAVIVSTPDDASLRDAERLSKLLFDKKQLRAQLLLNRTDRFLILFREERRPADIAAALDLPLLAAIPDSNDVYRALLAHKTALECDSRRVRRAIRLAADRLSGADIPLPTYCRPR